MIDLKIQDVMRCRNVARWHIVDCIKGQSLAEHNFNVAVIGAAIAIKKGVDPKPVMVAALLHDLSEVLTGDIPPTTKKLSGYKDPTDGELSVLGHLVVNLDPQVHRILKLADLVDAVAHLELYGHGIHALRVHENLSRKLNDQDAVDVLDAIIDGEPTMLVDET